MNQETAVLKLGNRLKITPLLGGVDLNLGNPPWEEADYRVCVVQNGDFFTKATSATVIQLTAIVRQAEKALGAKIFIDFTFQPDVDDTEILRMAGQKEVFGWCSFRTLSDFDLLMCSFSIHFETMGVCTSWWGSGIEPHFYDRMRNPEAPLTLAGGVIGQLLEPIFGPDKGSLVDLLFLGEGEDRLAEIIKFLVPNKERRITDRFNLIKDLVLKFDNLYFPQGYTHVYDDSLPPSRREIGSFVVREGAPEVWNPDYCPVGVEVVGNHSRMTGVIKNYPWVPTSVKFYRSFNPRPPMFEDRLLLTTNDSAGRGELQISHGALKHDTVITTDCGLFTMEQLYKDNLWARLRARVWTAQGWKAVTQVLHVGTKEVMTYVTHNGREISATGDHRLDLGSKFSCAPEVGQDLRLWEGLKVGGPRKDLSVDEAYLMGFIQGDGSVTKSGNTIIYCNQDEVRFIREQIEEVGWNYREDQHTPTVTAFHLRKEASHKIREFFDHPRGYHPFTHYEKRASLKITTYSLEHQRAFLQGWMDADGTATPYREKLSSAKKGDIQVAQHLFHNLGVQGFIDFESSDKGIQEGIRECWHLLFDRTNFIAFAKSVGFRLPRKSALAEASWIKSEGSKFDVSWSSHYAEPEDPLSQAHLEEEGNPSVKREALVRGVGLRAEKIVSRTTEVVDTYDISVAECPEYMANGLRVENCMGFGACYFCAEGNEAGVWREFDLPAIVEGMHALKTTCAPNVISFFSLNTNYYSRVFDLYHEVAKQFQYISVIAFRADVVSAVPDYIRFLKALGTFRLTIALEGISERIRAAYLNKNLTWDQFLRTCEFVFRERFVMLKMNLIFSGHEEPEDIEEFIQAMEKMNALKVQYGAKTSCVWSMTTLVTYWNTGLQWQPRKATIAEVFQERVFRGAVARGRELGHRFRFNSGSEFVWQQMLVDAGRRVSDVALEAYRENWTANKPLNTSSFFDALNHKLYVSLGLGDPATPEGEAKVRAFFGREYGLNEVNPSVAFDILPPYVKRIYYMAVGKRGTKYCLSSPATPVTRCKTCGFCEDKEFSDTQVAGRNFSSGKTVADVEAEIFRNKPKGSLRVVYSTRPDMLSRSRYKIVNNHFVAARFLASSTRMLETFHAVGNYSDYIMTFHDQEDSWSGLGYFDIMFRLTQAEIGELLQGGGLIKEVNSGSRASRVMAAYPIAYTPNCLRRVTHVWKFQTVLPKLALTEAFSNYNGKMKTVEKGASGLPEVIEEPYSRDDFGIYMTQKANETVGHFTLGHRYNPYMAIDSFFGQKPKQSRQVFSLERTASIELASLPCGGCGRESGMDVIMNRQAVMCPDCVAKLLTGKVAQLK